MRRAGKLKSTLFKPHERDIPAPQKEMFFTPLQFSRALLLSSSSMSCNYSTSPLLHLPPKIRVRIYRLVLGHQQLWIGHSDYEMEMKRSGQSSQWHHRWGHFYHSRASFDGTSSFKSALHIGLLRVSRQIYTETALLPYALNNFAFKDDSARKFFEQSARLGKKQVQNKAVGSYEIATLQEFRARHVAR